MNNKNEVDEILHLFGIKDYDELTGPERDTYHKWLNTIATSAITPDDMRRHIQSMRLAVETELIDTDEFIYFLWFKRINRKHVLLKARLKNYLLLETFLNRPERAKEMLDFYKKLAR